MVQRAANKNLWVAASDGDLERVQYLIENEGMSPNDKDQNSYSPMHAAASYAHLHLLAYLVSIGGNVNLPDDDGDTPLFVVENEETARWLVEHGAYVSHTNEEGLTPADALEDEHPEISTYLRSLLPTPAGQASQVPQISPSHQDGNDADDANMPSTLAVDTFTSQQTTDLLAETQRIMLEAEQSGENPDEKLREVVERAVREGFDFGGRLGESAGSTQEGADEEERKRVRGEGEGGGVDGSA